MSPSSHSRPPAGKRSFGKTLGSLLRYLEGVEIIVELKTGKRFRGVLQSADDQMNLSLTARGNSDENEAAEERHIRGSNIRFIHFPDNANLPELIQGGIGREEGALKKYARGRRKS